MKKLIIFMSLGTFFFTSCSKEESSDLITEQTADSVYVLNQSNGTPTWEIIKYNPDETSVTTNRGNSSHTHGDIAGFGTFNGTQNNGGSHGGAEIHIPNQIHMFLETSSVALIGNNGNEAIYGGLITEVVFNNIPPPPPPPPCPTFPNCPPPPPPPPCDMFEVGTYLYFSVIDNGQGDNADSDEYRPVLFPSCSASPDGFATFPWHIFGSTVLDQNESDHVKVN